MTNALSFQWRRPGCGERCLPRQHEPDAHEEYGYQRAQQDAERTLIEIEELHINLNTATVTVNGSVTDLSGREWEVLAYLAQRTGQWCSVKALMSEIWGHATDRAVRITVSRIKHRLGPAGRLIVNRPWHGYALVPDPSTLSADRQQQRQERFKRWARNYDRCTWCKTTDHPHEGKGLCRLCRERQRSAGKFI